MEACSKADIKRYIMTISLTYGAYRDYTEQDREALADIWFEVLKVYPKPILSEAVKRVVENCKYVPRPADVCTEAEKLLSANEPSETDYWAEAEKAILAATKLKNRFNYTAYDRDAGMTQGEFARWQFGELWERLSPAVRGYFSTKESLLSLCSDCDLIYEKGRFLRVLPNLIRRQKTLESLPPSLRDIIADTAEKLRLEKC